MESSENKYIREHSSAAPEALEWLSRTLEEVTSSDPDAFVLILTHPMTYNTVYGSDLGEYWYSARQLTSCLKALGGTITLGVAQGGMLTISTQDAYYLQNVMRAPTEKKKVTKAAKPPAAKAA